MVRGIGMAGRRQGPLCRESHWQVLDFLTNLSVTKSQAAGTPSGAFDAKCDWKDCRFVAASPPRTEAKRTPGKNGSVSEFARIESLIKLDFYILWKLLDQLRDEKFNLLFSEGKLKEIESVILFCYSFDICFFAQ